MPDKIGEAARIFEAVAATEINIDMIVQNVSAVATSRTDISFTLPKTDGVTAITALNALQEEVGFTDVLYDDQIGKVSVVGVGMRSHPGVTAKFFTSLAAAGVNIGMIFHLRDPHLRRRRPGRRRSGGRRRAHSAFGLDATEQACGVRGDRPLGRPGATRDGAVGDPGPGALVVALGWSRLRLLGPQARPPLPTPPRTVFSAEPRTQGAEPRHDEVVSPSSAPSTAVPTASPAHHAERGADPDGEGPLVVIDPGHSGRSIRSTHRPPDGLRDVDYPNYPEIYETFDVSNCVATGLRAEATGSRDQAPGPRQRQPRRPRPRRERGPRGPRDQRPRRPLAGPGLPGDLLAARCGSAAALPTRCTGGPARSATVFRDADVARASERAPRPSRRSAPGRRADGVGAREHLHRRAPLEPGNLASCSCWRRSVGLQRGRGAQRVEHDPGDEHRDRGGVRERACCSGSRPAVPLPAGRVAQPRRGRAAAPPLLRHGRRAGGGPRDAAGALRPAP